MLINTKEKVILNWQYNAWGGKYPPFDEDALAAKRICQHLSCLRRESSLVCEGGALEGNGAGVLMTTSSCLLSSTRNPSFSRNEVEAELRSKLEVEHIIWVDGGGLAGDDTDGHIDQQVRFADSQSVIIAKGYGPDDPLQSGFDAIIEELKETLKARRANLQKISDRYFELINKYAVIKGTNKDDWFDVERMSDGNTKVTVTVDDETKTFMMKQDKNVLDAVLNEDLDAPYSCQGGICSTCIARVTEGKAEMQKNQILTDSELEEGLILTCQAYPTTPTLVVDYDDV